ncbi:MAG: M23 family metallopeptidase [Bauldia sp.]|nr:M23 family metallopeptidase [Bauldia sp.]
MVLAAALTLTATSALAFDVALPIDCTVGTDCAVQHYVDRDPGEGGADYMCGHQTYDGHDGIDFRIPDLRAMAEGVTVLAAADGVVRAIRDGMEDRNVAETGVEAVANRECGNGVMIDHDGGWATQYCHMKMGSIRVKPGDPVSRGAQLGAVGLSGMTEFPHVHFTVYRDGHEIDPFAMEPRPAGAACRFAGDEGTAIWTPIAEKALVYRPAFVLNAGFATGPVEMDDIETGAVGDVRVTPDSPALVFYGRAIGLEAGDVQRLVITAPDGSVFASQEIEPLDRTKAQYMAFTGRKRRDTPWPAGTWQGRYAVIRDGAEVAFREVALVMPKAAGAGPAAAR